MTKPSAGREKRAGAHGRLWDMTYTYSFDLKPHKHPKTTLTANLSSQKTASKSTKGNALPSTLGGCDANSALNANIPTNATSVVPDIQHTNPALTISSGFTAKQHTMQTHPTVAATTVDPQAIPIPTTTDAKPHSPIQHTRPLPTPIDLIALTENLEGYDPTLTHFLVSGFTHGFEIGDDTPTTDCSPVNSKTVEQAPEVIHDKLNKEIHAGRIAGPFNKPPYQPFHISPLSLRPKKQSGKYRLLHNLSYPYDENSINYNIPNSKRTVQYASVGEAIKKIQKLPRGAYAAKTDIESAFRLLPIHPKYYPKLGMQVDGLYYFDKTLPQGLASSCQIFETFSTAIQWMIEQRIPDIQIVHYLDDFLVIAANKQQCQEHLDALLTLFSELRVPIAHDKTTTPAQVITFLGIELDTNTFQARLPQDKLVEYRTALQEYLNSPKIRKKALDSLIGKLSFAASVIPARAFLRRLINLSSAVKTPFFYIRLHNWAKADIRTWLTFMEQYNGITFFRHNRQIPSDEINLISDASKLGFGAAYGKNWIQALWPKAWTAHHISILELFPIYVILNLYAHKLQNSNILFHCDNSAVVTILNKQSSKDAKIMSILRPLILVLMQNNINLRSVHIPGKLNILTDKISRFQVTPDLLQRYGMHPQPQVIPHHLRPENFNLRPTNWLKPHWPLPRILPTTNIGWNTRPLRMTYLTVNRSHPRLNLSHYLSSTYMRTISQCHTSGIIYRR